MFHQHVSYDPASRARQTPTPTPSYLPSAAYSSQYQPHRVSPQDLSHLTTQFRQQTIAPEPRPDTIYNHHSAAQASYSAYASNYGYNAHSQQPQQQQQQQQQPPQNTSRPASTLRPQCTGCYYPASRRHTTYLAPPLDDDEGFDEPDSHDERGGNGADDNGGAGQAFLDADARLAYRRSTDFSTLEGRVVRPIRLRKRPRRTGSEESGASSASSSASAAAAAARR